MLTAKVWAYNMRQSSDHVPVVGVEVAVMGRSQSSGWIVVSMGGLCTKMWGLTKSLESTTVTERPSQTVVGVYPSETVVVV